jgi:hypothetical protein
MSFVQYFRLLVFALGLLLLPLLIHAQDTTAAPDGYVDQKLGDWTIHFNKQLWESDQGTGKTLLSLDRSLLPVKSSLSFCSRRTYSA